MLETGPLPLPDTPTSTGFSGTHQLWEQMGNTHLGVPLSRGSSLPAAPALRTPATPLRAQVSSWSLCLCQARWASAAHKLPDLSHPRSSLQPLTPSLRICSDNLLSVLLVDSCTALHQGGRCPSFPSSGLGRGPTWGDCGA